MTRASEEQGAAAASASASAAVALFVDVAVVWVAPASMLRDQVVKIKPCFLSIGRKSNFVLEAERDSTTLMLFDIVIIFRDRGVFSSNE